MHYIYNPKCLKIIFSTVMYAQSRTVIVMHSTFVLGSRFA